MKLSARNQLAGKVVSIKEGAVNGIVVLDIEMCIRDRYSTVLPVQTDNTPRMNLALISCLLYTSRCV